MTRKRLPIGIQNLREIRTEDYYYVDKTPFAVYLAEEGKYYFLSRPRRFGKSLFLDTLAEAFSGHRELFAGLYLEDHWDWDRRHPVVRLSFAEGRLETRAELDRRIRKELAANAARLGVPLEDPEDIAGSFGELISRAAERHGQRTVVLVDEYDKPILDNLTEPEIARQMREGLRNLYSAIKGRDADLRFVFLTGVSKFSKVSLFSGLNNLNDITLDERYSTLCGYTEADLDAVFGPEFAAAAEAGQPLPRETVRQWYNGYSWGSGERVYNPFDVLLLLDKRQFRPWWFETAKPRFLVEWLKQRGFFTPRLECLYADDALLSAFDVEAIEPEAMLWQTGYLTIVATHSDADWTEYTLAVPNHEVRTALNRQLFAAWHPDNRLWLAAGRQVRQWLDQGAAADLHAHFLQLFASIPHTWYDTSPIARYEGYYASVFYSHLASLGLTIIPKEVSLPGRCDLTVRHGNTVWVFEFKVIDGDSPSGDALAQLKARGYAAKYRAPGVRVIEVGVEFSKTQRQIVGWEVG